jgi:TPR repeat protein
VALGGLSSRTAAALTLAQSELIRIVTKLFERIVVLVAADQVLILRFMKWIDLSKTFPIVACIALLGAEGARASDAPTPEENFERAVALLEKSPSDPMAILLLVSSAAAGHADAANRIGYQYDQGLGVPLDKEKARAYFEIAAEAGLPKARYNLAKTILQGDNPENERAVELLGQAAAEGIELAAFALGSIYYDGLYGQEKNLPLALWYFEQSANSGNPEAQNFCGAMYETAEGTRMDVRAAAQWYRSAALSGHAKAQASYGDMLFFGRGVERDRVEALMFLMLSADQGEAMAIRLQEEYLPSYSNEEIERARRAADSFQPVPRELLHERA